MRIGEAHRKRIKHYDQPGDFHELTFSCYHRFRLLTNDQWRGFLTRSIDRALAAEACRLVAFVFMPEHVHLLVYPADGSADEKRVSRVLARIKRPCSAQVKEKLVESGSRVLARLTIGERPGRVVFRFWQEGPGYDRNLNTEEAVMASIDYIHLNPVRRGLCRQAVEWRWSSAKWYVTAGREQDPLLPRIDGVPSGLFCH